MAISALVAVEPVADELVSRIKDRMEQAPHRGRHPQAATWVRS